MKRAKKLYTLLGVLAVFVVLTFCVSKYEEKQEQIKNSNEVVLEINSENVTSLSWEYDSEALSFHKTEGWLYDEDEAFPVDDEKVEDLLAVFEAFEAAFIIEEVEDFGQYGIDDPICTIQIETADATYEILLGDYSTMDSQRYVSIGDGNVYLASTDPMESYEITLSDMILHDETEYFKQVNAVEFAGDVAYKITYEEESTNTYCAEDVYFTEQNGKTVPLDTTLVDDYLDTVSNLSLTDYVTYNATEEEVAAYGLSEPDLTISVNHSWEDEESEETKEADFVLHVGSVSEENEDGESEIKAYVRVADSQIIYEITEDTYDILMAASYNDLRHQEIFTGDFEDVYQIDIALDGEEYSITTSESEDEEEEGLLYHYDGNEIDIDSFSVALHSVTASYFAEKELTEKEEISILLYLNNDNYPSISMKFYRYDGNSCIAVLDGDAIALVPREQVVDLVEAVNGIVLE